MPSFTPGHHTLAYNFNSPSPYAGPRRSPRWPWVFASILLIAVVGVSTILLQNGLSSGGNQGNRDLALITPTSEITMAPSQTPVPSPTPVSLEDSTELATEWITLWMNEDYAAMYHLTSAATRDNMTERAFVDKYTGVQRVAGINRINARLDGEVNEQGLVNVAVTYDSGLVGEIPQTMELAMIHESMGWRVIWSPSLIFTELGSNGCVDWTGESFTRGRILDSQGRVFAEDAKVTRVSVVPADMIDPEWAYSSLSEVLGMDRSTIEARVNANPNANWEVVLKDMPADQEISLLNSLGDIDGVRIHPATQRHYPYGSSAVHLVGYVSLVTAEDIERDNSLLEGQLIGRTGIEYGANDILSGKPGGTLYAVDCTSRTKRAEIASAQGQPPVDIYLTVDAEFQKAVDESMYHAEKEIDGPNGKKITIGQRGAAVVIDPRTGAIMAMVSHPSFDPNGIITGNISAEDQALLDDPVMLAWLNRAVNQPLPTGSIFKVITTAGGMHTLNYTDQELLNCPATFELGGQTYKDWMMQPGLTAVGMLTLHQALVNSCNTVFYGIGEQMDYVDSYALANMARSFGLGEPVAVPYFPANTSGTVPDPTWKLENKNDGWATGDNVLLAIGQGDLTATPLQMAVAYAAIANGGDVLVPYVIDRTQVAGEDAVQVGERQVKNHLPLSDTQIGWIQSALRDQTSDPNGYGSSRIFGSFPWSISGKTGTAQNERANEDERPHSWFAAYAPYPGNGEPAEIASIVMFENTGEGVTFAAPVTKEIYQIYLDRFRGAYVLPDTRQWL
ncbi:MAG: penicillin-binding transpeptidase domain-containing protein [Thermomicrobiales bacterium]|nr:penicillin-binding transpeptidase domain-containing protein [Thermomicrobiales bacterium]